MTPSTRADEEDLAARFERLRPRLLRVAHAVTGSLADAEDNVQEAWFRLRRADPTEIGDLGAWLTTVVARLALDTLRGARVRRERYVGPWLPEPLVSDLGEGDPAEAVVEQETVTTALLVLLERLTPAERTAFLLHDVFGLSFEETARIVERTPAAARQLAARARRHVEEGRPRFPPSREEHIAVVEEFARAATSGNVTRLLTLLDDHVVLRSDGGGRVAAAPPAEGALRVARLAVALSRRPVRASRVTLVNGAPGILLDDWLGTRNVLAVTIDRGRIVALDLMRNPEKLHGAAAAPLS